MAPRIQFDFSAIDPRTRALLIGGVVVILMAITGLIVLLTRDGGDQTAGIVTPSPSPTFASTVAPSPAGPPTETATPAPTATLAPYEYVVQEGETLGFIIQLYGYRDFTIIPDILALNGLPNEQAIQAGQTIMIPRQTPTPGPTFTNTATPNPLVTPGTPTPTGTPEPTVDPNVTVTYQDCTPETRCTTPDGKYWIHVVQPGDTISGIVFRYGGTTVECVREANGFPPHPQDVVIFEGQQIKVCIMVTLTPTLTPTGGPDSTATPTPQPVSPSLLAPARNAMLPREDVVLQWAAVRPLAQNQWYLVVVRNISSGEEIKATTRSNSYRVAASQLQSGAEYEWHIAIVGAQSLDAPSISLPGETRTFTWGG